MQYFKKYLFLAVPSAAVYGLSPVVGRGATLGCAAWASHYGGFSFWRAEALQCRLSCPEACGIFQDQGLNLCPMHWQADS